MTDDTPEEKKREQLLEVIRKSRHQASAVEEAAREEVAEARRIQDLADPTEDFFEALLDDSYVPPQQWDRQIGDWTILNERLQARIVDPAQLRGITSGGSITSLSTASVIMSYGPFVPALPPERAEQAEKARKRFTDVISREARLDAVGKELERLHLARAGPSSRSIQELLEEALRSLATPSSESRAPASVLIPLREAINMILSQLLQGRPKQERARSIIDRTVSIGNQLARDGVPTQDMHRLAEEANDLIGALSAGKQTDVPDPAFEGYFTRVVLWAKAFLSSLDERKLRSAP